MDRRNFLRVGGVAASAAVAGPLSKNLGAARPSTAQSAPRPNILVVIVDQLRAPRWFPITPLLDTYLPNLARLRRESISFANHFTAATACTPSRASLLTGLYSPQHAVLTTIVAGDDPNLPPGSPTEPPLDPRFPTWGTAMRSLGYEAWWFGKWHLTNNTACDLSPYGFAGGTCPSPDGLPGQGQYQDPCTVDQFISWLSSSQAASLPWCTTLSLDNPHDIAWYFRYTNCPAVNQTSAPNYIDRLPANFETPRALRQNKPGLQLLLLEGAEAALGVLEYSGANYQADWLKFINLYLYLQTLVDYQIGRALQALSQSGLASNTIVVFTADHGEYGGSHGLRGKGGAVYDEGINIPLYVKDPTGRFVTDPGQERSQLTSSVDILPMLLGIAGGGSTAWKQTYPYLSQRLDLTAILRNPAAEGRPYILSTTDEVVPIQLPSFANTPPSHVVAYRTATAKLATYNYWDTSQGQLSIITTGEQQELYDYTQIAGAFSGAAPGTWEVDNVVTSSPRLYAELRPRLDHAISAELRAPLPAALAAVQQQAVNAYIAYAASPTAVKPFACPTTLPYPVCSPQG